MTVDPTQHPPTQSLRGHGPTEGSNPWWPAPVVSLVFPMVGLLLVLDGKDRRRLAWGSFFIVFCVHIALSLSHAVIGMSVNAEGLGENALGTVLRALHYFWTLAAGVSGLVYTHDEVVRAQPTLGRPLLFLRNPPT